MNKPQRWKAVLYALALVVFGAIIGAVVTSKMSPTPQTLRVGRVDEISATIRERLSTLDLTPDQKTHVEPLIKKAAEELEASHLDCLNRVNKALDNLHAAIRPQLIPGQQQKLQALESQRAAKMWSKYNYKTAATNASAH